MFDIFYSGKKPGLFAHEKEATNIEQAQQLSRTRYFWWVNYLTDYSDWDFLWEPVPWQSHQRHAWPSQWQKDSGTYLIPKHWHGKETNYRIDNQLKRLSCTEGWHNIDCYEFDTSWHPDPSEPNYKHEFGTQWWNEGGPVYSVAGATEIKYETYPLARLLPNQSKEWQSLCEVDYDFDYSWRPHPKDPPYIYIFGNQWWNPEVMPTVSYKVPGAVEIKYVNEPKAQLLENYGTQYRVLVNCDFDFSWVPDPGDPPYIYVFGNQWHSAEIMPSVEYHMPEATERKYVDWPRATMCPDPTRWTIPEGANPDHIDFSWVPDPGEPPYIYQFATQHQKTGGPIYTVPGATETKYLEHIEIKIEVETVPIVEIDHMDGNAGNIPGTIKKIRYFDNYRDTLIRLARSLQGEHEFVWVCSSVCDYSNFDFTWHPEKWQQTMLHVFASDKQKFGDTFYMHVPTFAERAEKKALLEWYSVNFVPRLTVPRRPIPVIHHNYDSHVDAVKNIEFSAPLALFTVDEHIDQALTTVPLWRQEVKTITPITKGASAVIVPKVAVGDVQTQLYDYPYVDKTHVALSSPPLDIVFISNGETNAEDNFEWLLQVTKANMNSNLNRIHRVDGVNGRVAAYHAAARASTTPWFFAVFAKLHVNKDFDWSWQPDRMQQAKHYIFHAENAVNGLIYGHQAMIAYNKKLTLENYGVGLDFTLDSPHEVVPILSGTAHYSGSAWSAWRTAFRETLKLRASLPDIENEYRLNQWLAKDNTVEHWSQKGAKDAVEYYESVDGSFEALKKSYEWSWLASYAFMKRSLTPDQ